MTAPTAITIGNFDGVHIGHSRLAHEARAAVGPSGRVIALAFDPHPSAILRPHHPVMRLSTIHQRRAWMIQAGADEVVALEPTRELLSRSPEDFIQWVMSRWQPQFIVEGVDFRFGAHRAGSVQTLQRLQSTYGFQVISVEAVETTLTDQAVVRVSSTLIRWLIARGRVEDTAVLLGRPYELEGAVVQGEKRGRTLGVPTANLECADFQLPADGVYAGSAMLPDGGDFPAALSVGTKPTFGRHARVCEAHLIGHSGPLDEYGQLLRVRFTRWLRDQLAFATAAELGRQIERDIARAAKMLADSRAVQSRLALA